MTIDEKLIKAAIQDVESWIRVKDVWVSISRAHRLCVNGSYRSQKSEWTGYVTVGMGQSTLAKAHVSAQSLDALVRKIKRELEKDYSTRSAQAGTLSPQKLSKTSKGIPGEEAAKLVSVASPVLCLEHHP